MNERKRLEAAIEVLEAQRNIVGDLVTDAALAPIRQRLRTCSTQVLRDVTVLFVDIVGSTELSARLDPEEVYSVIDGALADFATIVKKNHGDVVQFAGDSLLAVFGHLLVRPDDADCAVRSGLQIVRETHEKRTGGHGVSVRVGIHTGRVLLGGGLDEPSVIRGLTVNLAARMEQTAPIGKVRISEVTERHIRGRFVVIEDLLRPVKGIDAAVRSFIVEREANAVAIANHALERSRAPMLGREAELVQLQTALETVVANGAARSISIYGDPGIGKSRLLREFGLRVEQTRPQTVCIRASSQTLGNLSSWSLMRRIAHSGARVSAAFRKTLGTNDGNVAEHVIKLLGLGGHVIQDVQEDQLDLTRLALDALEKLVEKTAAIAGSIILILEDLHWADCESIALISAILQRCSHLPLLVVATTRDTKQQVGPLFSGAIADSICLKPLTETEAARLVDALAGVKINLTKDARRLYVQQSGGNPYFIEELVAVLVDDQGNQRPEGKHNPIAFNIPTTLSSTVQARLDSLDSEELALMRKASVIGTTFCLGPLGEPSVVDELVSGLVRRGFLRRVDMASVYGLKECEFAHQILHKFTYETILKAERHGLHRDVAQWLCRLSNAESFELDGQVAHHFEQSGDAEAALEWLLRAAVGAGRTSANLAAIELADRGLSLLRCGSRGRDIEFELIKIKAQSLFALSRRDDEATCLRQLDALANTSENAHRQLATKLLQARFELFSGNDFAAQSLAKCAVSLAAEINDSSQETWALSILASALMHRADRTGVREIAGLLMSRTSPTENPRRHIDAHHLLGGLDVDAGDLFGARLHFDEALSVARSIADKVHEAIQLHNVGDLQRRLGNYSLASSLLGDGLRLSLELELKTVEVHISCLLARIDIAVGNASASLPKIERGFVLAQSLSNKSIDAGLLILIAHAKLALGLTNYAEVHFENAASLVTGSNHSHEKVEALCGLATIAISKGDFSRARAYVDPILAELPNVGAAERIGAHFVCYQVLVQTGAESQAESHLRLAKDILDQMQRPLSETDVTMFRAMPQNRKVLNEFRASVMRGTAMRGPIT